MPAGTSPSHLPSSAQIETFEQARAYWDQQFGGKTLAITVHSGEREIPIRVRFDGRNDHAYTTDVGGKQKIGARVFDERRANAMSRIPSVIERPKRRLRNWGGDLLLESARDRDHYTVVLTWRPASDVYEFHSAHFLPIEEVANMQRHQDSLHQKNKGPLQKSGPFSRFPELEAPYGRGISPLGVHHGHDAVGTGSTVRSVASFVDLCKAHPPLAYARDVTLWRGDEPDLDAVLKAAPSGARWITVHPNGRDEKGVPVMIQETKSGSGVYHVVGGAGGKLNYLKLRGVKSEHEYRQESGERQKARREERKRQRESDKAAGTYESKQKARQDLTDQKHKFEAEFIDQVSRAMDWKPEDTAFPEGTYSGVSAEAREKAEARHHRELLARAQEAVEAARAQLLADADARGDALGEIPLESEDPEKLSVSDLDHVTPAPAGLGFATDYKGRAEAAGLTEQELAQETAALKDARMAEMPDGQRDAIRQRAETAARIRTELSAIRDPGIKADAKPVDAKRAVDLLKAEKRLRAIRKQARAAAAEIDQAEEPKAYVLEVGKESVDDTVQEDLANDLRTLRTRAFLSEVGKQDNYEDTLGRHIGAGAYNSLNALALTAAGSGLVDRGVVDVLGIAGASQALAWRLHHDLTAEEVADTAAALEQYHLDHYLKASDESLREAREWQEVAEEIDAGQAIDGHDLARAQELNARRREAIRSANRALGTALGEMEANAALVMALKQGKKDQIQVSLGKVAFEDAVRQARAIGLDRGDYQINSVGANRFLTVRGDAVGKLTQAVNREDLVAQRECLDIIEGRKDENNWLPLGVANRPDLAVHTPPGAAPRLAEPFTPGPDLERSIRDYIGGRTADGDPPADILADLLTQGTAEKVPQEQRDAYYGALDKIAPLKGEDGRPVRAERHQEAFEGYADAFVRDRYGSARLPLHRQRVPVDGPAVEALHRALAEEPTGMAAFKPIGELTAQDQGALREFFGREIAKDDERATGLRADLGKLETEEPEREVDDMFGRGTNPAWTDWKSRRDAKAAELNAAGLGWGKYIEIMGSPEKAYSAVQDLARSRVVRAFHGAHNTLRPDAPLKLGRTVVRGNLDHLDAVDPDAREKRLTEQRGLIDALRNRAQGRYASGAVSDKVAASKEQMEALQQSQMGFFSTEELPDDQVAGTGNLTEKPLAADERYTLGHAAERQIAAMMPMVGKNFQPGRPTKLWQLSMNGRFVNQQRSIRLIERSKRVMLAQGVGSGKTVIGLAGFTHLHGQGKAKRGLFVVPSIVQGQFSGEALRYLEPGKFKWHIEPGASRESRIAAYKDQATHFSVVTHQALRDDLVHLGAQAAGIEKSAMAARLDEMTPAERKDWMRGVLDHHGINIDYLMVDEGHDLLNRRGKENSLLANTIDALSDNTEYYVNASADPVKNDVSEIFSILQKMNPARYTDRDAFLRRYGVDTAAAKDGLRREIARHFYPGRIESGVPAHKKEVSVPLSAGQHQALDEVDKMLARAKLARMNGKVDVDAVKHLSPGSFADVDPSRHEEIAKTLQDSLGIIKGTAIQRVIDTHADNAKVDRLSQIVTERHGKPGVVFAHSREAVRQIAERLQKEGHRVVTITGADSAKEKEAKKLAFRPEKGEPTADIMVASDAGAVGMNAQRGQWLVQFDTPMTSKTHAQRNGRIDRIGQKNEVELIDLVADHPSERANRKRLAEKYALREILTSPLEGLDDTGLAAYLARARAEKEERKAA